MAEATNAFLSAIFSHPSRLNIVNQAAHALVVSGIIAWLVFKYRLISSLTPIDTNAVSVFSAFGFTASLWADPGSRPSCYPCGRFFACSIAIWLICDNAFAPEAPSIAFTAMSCTCCLASASCFSSVTI